MTIQSKPLIRWAGSKRKLLPRLVKHAPSEYKRYVEPFCGSACLFFELSPKKALLSDINEELVNALVQIKNDSSLYKQLTSMPASEAVYYELRDKDPQLLDDKNRAIRFLYLNRFCFNGVYRTNRNGRFNVPMGKKTGGFPDETVFLSAMEKLKGAKVVVSDYSTILKDLGEGDFVYMDPPYSKSGKFTGEYGVGSFGSDQLPEIISSLRLLDEKKVKFLFSYRACSETIHELKKSYYVEKFNVKRHVSGFKSGWDNSEEILVRNYD